MSSYDHDVGAQENIALALYAIANELNKLGLSGAQTGMGALELLAKEVRDGLARLANAISGAGEAIQEER